MNPRYELLSPIAEGGLGTVWKALDRQVGREVAIKRIRADKAGTVGATVDALIREAGHQSALQHPNIVAVHEAGVDDEGGFLVMELVHGETLEHALQRSALTAVDFDALVRQTLEGMIAAHEAGIIHLDLKPENIMLTRPAAGGLLVKILDFGLATSIQENANQPTALHGSVYFMAPEQFERTVVDVRTDLYALGCVYYDALTQKVPFDGETKPQVIVAHLYHRVVSLATIRPDLPEPTVRWVEWLMSRQPANRPISAAAALHAYETGAWT